MTKRLDRDVHWPYIAPTSAGRENRAKYQISVIDDRVPVTVASIKTIAHCLPLIARRGTSRLITVGIEMFARMLVATHPGAKDVFDKELETCTEKWREFNETE